MRRQFAERPKNRPSVCRLCLKPGDVIHSHIISDFLHQPLYDEKHRLHVLSGDPNVEYDRPQQGLREYLLCKQCDNVLIESYERHGRDFLNTVDPTAWPPIDPRLWQSKLHPISGIDYPQVKLFYLSLLWRMSVASHPFFKELSLGPYEDALRKMLLKGQPGEPDEFAIMCFSPHLNGKHNADLITRPERSKLEQRTSFRCIIRGLIYVFMVGKAPLSNDLNGFVLKKDGSWIIVREDVQRIDFLAEAYEHLSKLMKQRRAVQ